MVESSENPFQPRLGRMRAAAGARRARTFLSRVSSSISRAGSTRGRRQMGGLKRHANGFARRVIVKARFVRMSNSSTVALGKHLQYIGRDDAVRSTDDGGLFTSDAGQVDQEKFLKDASTDRHHFRLIVSPEDGAEIQDMKPFVRDLVSEMERDLGTRLEWVGAIHENTDFPHAHFVIRGRREDGRDLVIPKGYVSRGIRQRAEELVTLELGPQTQLEKDLKLARYTGAERVTSNDRILEKMRDAEGHVSVLNSPPRYRQINVARLQKLTALGLAEKLSRTTWRVSDGFLRTLDELGERQDIIKKLNRALAQKDGRSLQSSNPLRQSGDPQPLTGAVLETGFKGDMHDEPFVVIDGLDGCVSLVPVARDSVFEEIERGMVVTVSSPGGVTRASDKTIAAIAAENNGLYSEALHRGSNPSASNEFIKAHIRRLEAMRRAGLTQRTNDGIWSVPSDYIARVDRLQRRRTGKDGARIQIESWSKIKNQIQAFGATWLDELPIPTGALRGFGAEVLNAREKRLRVLHERGIIEAGVQSLSPKTLNELNHIGISRLGRTHSALIGKSYQHAPNYGKIEGTYSGSIKVPEGRFAVIERQRSFTLVPWRPVIERAKGQFVSGAVRGRSISWTFGRVRSGPT